MTTSSVRILLTGGTGRLGKELSQLLPDIAAPGRNEMDITQLATIEAAVERYRPDVIVHTAAYTNVALAEKEREACWRVNVEGTRNIAHTARQYGLFLIHISTDYVFDGNQGGYREEDPVGPVRNYYALSKLVSEEIARTVPHHLVIRTSFRPREWPYPSAFIDVLTSQDYVDVIAPQIACAVERHREIPYSTLHIATERKSVFELARRRKPDVQPASKQGVQVQLPDDISLDSSRWRELERTWKVKGHGPLR